MLLSTTISKKASYNAVTRTSFNRFKVSLCATTTRPFSVVGLPSSSSSSSSLDNLLYFNHSGRSRATQQDQQVKGLSSIRFFSSAPTPPPPTPKDEEEQDQGIVSRVMGQIITPRNQFYALAAGGTIGAYLISRGFLAFTSFFTHLHPAFVARWAFYTGFGCATGKFFLLGLFWCDLFM